MRWQYFGDSYDIIKKSLIAWLSEFGDWSVHPMFTEDVRPEMARSFSRFLGARILSNAKLTMKTDRASYFSSCRKTGNLFLDPDTGVRIMPCGGSRSINYVFGPELVEWSHARPSALTLVFDQSYSRGSQDRDIQQKLRYFLSKEVHGFAYSSHAPFLVLSADDEGIDRTRETLLEASGLPRSRLVGL